VRKSGGRVFHYGWVKNPVKQLEKLKQFHKLWHDDETAKRKSGDGPYDYLKEVDMLAVFTEAHPAPMAHRVANQNWLFKYDTRQIKLRFKDKLLYAIERLTGKRLFEYKNYTLLR
jgi:hypothetical protein